MSIVGNWKLIGGKGGAEFLKQAGVPDETAAKMQETGKDMQMSLTEVDGEMKMSLTNSAGSKTEFTLIYGQECEAVTPSGLKFKGVASYEGGKLNGKFSRGTHTLEVDADGNLKHTIVAGDVTYERISKRV